MPKHPARLLFTLALLLTASSAGSARSQGLPPPPGSNSPDKPGTERNGPASFDVVSVHEHRSDDHNMMWRNNADGIAMTNVALQALISSAYNVKMDLVSGGPAWVSDKGFDIEAKVLPAEGTVPIKLTREQQRTLLLALLADRFHLKAHIESKILPIYDLAVANGGPKMKVVPARPPSDDQKPTDFKPGDLKERGSANFGPGYIQAHAYKMSSFADNLGFIVQRTVRDKTGLTGDYDIDLTFTPEDQAGAATDKADNGTEPKPSIYAALPEQLGLKLIPTKGPVNTLVIDHIELPTAN